MLEGLKCIVQGLGVNSGALGCCSGFRASLRAEDTHVSKVRSPKCIDSAKKRAIIRGGSGNDYTSALAARPRPQP